MALLMQEVYAELTGTEPQTTLIDIDGEKFYGAGYEDHTRVPADIGKLGALGWTPVRGMKETLRSVMGWYLDNKDEMLATIGD
jgi:nucleoside-diphosphate-sugar epimerase